MLEVGGEVAGEEVAEQWCSTLREGDPQPATRWREEGLL